MKRLSAIVIFLTFALTFSTMPHSYHPSDYDAWDMARRGKLQAEENTWRADELERIQDEKDKNSAMMNLFTFINPTMGTIISISMTLDTIFGGKECPKCKEQVDSLWEHRRKCPAGHFHWGCVDVEASNHFFCPPHPTDCIRCYGTGCYHCHDPNKGNKCLKCGEAGSHQCPFE